MKAITLWQPWATLKAIEAKRFETRSWKTDYRGPIAIHAAKRPLDDDTYALCWDEPFTSELVKAGAMGLLEDGPVLLPGGLPYGAIVAVGFLAMVYFIHKGRMLSLYPDGTVIAGAEFHLPGEPERSFGDFSQGRYAWEIVDTKALEKPIPCRGYQQLWDVSEDVRVKLAEVT